MITNRSCSCGPPSGRSAEAVPGLSDEAHSRAATASTRSKSGLGLGPTIPSRTSLLRACLVHGRSGYLTSWLTRASGLDDGRLGLGGIIRYWVAALTRHGVPKAELACGASACTPVGQIIQPCADSIGKWRLAQCPHRKSSPVRSTRYDARTAGPHRSHVWFISCLPSFGCATAS